MKMWIILLIPPVGLALLGLWLLTLVPLSPTAPPQWVQFIMLYGVAVFFNFIALEGWALWRKD